MEESNQSQPNNPSTQISFQSSKFKMGKNKIIIAIVTIVILGFVAFGATILYPNFENNIEQTNEITEEEPNRGEGPPITPANFDRETSDIPPPFVLELYIERAISSGSYEELTQYMSETVQFEIISSGETFSITPEEVTTNLSYLDTAESPWNFDQEDSIIEGIKTSNPEYNDLFLGISSNDMVSAFGFDFNDEGRIGTIKVADSYASNSTE